MTYNNSHNFYSWSDRYALQYSMEQVKQNQKQYIDLTQQHSLVQIGNQSVVPLWVSKISDKPTTHKSVGDIETMKKKVWEAKRKWKKGKFDISSS